MAIKYVLNFYISLILIYLFKYIMYNILITSITITFSKEDKIILAL